MMIISQKKLRTVFLSMWFYNSFHEMQRRNYNCYILKEFYNAFTRAIAAIHVSKEPLFLHVSIIYSIDLNVLYNIIKNDVLDRTYDKINFHNTRKTAGSN